MKKKNKSRRPLVHCNPATKPPNEFDLKMLGVLQKITTESGLTYEQLAPLVGVSIFTLARWFTKGIGNVHRATRIQVVHFIEGYQAAKESGKLKKFLEGRSV